MTVQLSLKKNVIIILIDGGRLDFAQKSAIFNKLKSKSIFFPQAITYAPYTTAAMHAVLSGCYGNRTGVDSYWHFFKFKNDKFKTLAEYLSEKGYSTYADGHTELVIPKFGYDTFHIHDERNTELVNWHSELLEKMNSYNKEGKKFFLYLHYSNIHTGIMNEVLKVYNNFSKEYFDNQEMNIQRYSRLFNNAEHYLEKILQKINDLNFDKNSIILVLSDHGIGVGEKYGERAYGAFCYDYTLKTFAYLLNNDFHPQEISNQIRHVDFMPTILEMLGIKIDDSFEKLDGESLIPLINGKDVSEKIAYSETGNPLSNKAPPKEPNTKSVRTSKWKLIFNEYDSTKELYDLSSDPKEEKNLIGTGLEIENILWNHLLEISSKRT